MRRASFLATLALVVGSLLVGPSPGLGQGPGMDADRRELLESVETYYQERLARELQVEPEQRTELFEVLSQFEAARGELMPRRMQLLADVRRVLRQEGGEAEAREFINEYRELRRDELELQVREEDRLLEILTPTQVLRLQILREEFRNEIRRLLDDDGPRDFGPERRRGFRDWLPGFRR